MAAEAAARPSPAERLISLTIQGTWVLWAIGGLYIVGPALGWTLAAMAIYQAGEPSDPGVAPRDPVAGSVVVAWIAGMAAMLAILLIGHLNNGLGAAQTLKSAIGWAKGWALLAVYPAAAYALRVRPEVIYRAVCRLGLQTLILVPFFLAAPLLHLPPTLYVSPLKVLGGSTSEFFAVVLYTIDPDAGIARWQFFAPWSPAAGMVAVVHTLCAIEERSRAWRWIGVLAGLAIAVLSESRLALVALAIVWPVSHIVARSRHPAFWFAGAGATLVAGLSAEWMGSTLGMLKDRFTHARPASSRVRAALGRIAVERGRNEAPLFGHGVVERGPHLVEYMPIGSHHTWFGLFFVKGLAGVVALAAPMAYSLLLGLWLATLDGLGRLAFAMLLILAMYSFGENLEVLSYLYWPALVIVGAAASRPLPRRTRGAPAEASPPAAPAIS